MRPSPISAQTYCVCGTGTPGTPAAYCTDTNQGCGWGLICPETAGGDPGDSYIEVQPVGDCTRYYSCSGGRFNAPDECDPDHDNPIEALCFASGALSCGGGIGGATPIPEGGGGGVIAPPGATPTPTPVLGNIRVRGLSTDTYQTLSCPEIRALSSGITSAQFRVDGPMRRSDVRNRNQALSWLQTVTHHGYK